MAVVSPLVRAYSSTLARPEPYIPSDWPVPCGAVYASVRHAGGVSRSNACFRCRESSRDVAVTFGVHILFVFVVYLVPETEIDALMEAHTWNRRWRRMENWMRKSPTECRAGGRTGRECLECCAIGE